MEQYQETFWVRHLFLAWGHVLTLSSDRPSRFISLLYFAQSLFLVFAAVYIAKESIEQVILGSGAHDHAVGGHGHEGSHSHGGESERSFPHFLLLCAAAASTFSGAALGNHCKLVDGMSEFCSCSEQLTYMT